MNTNCLEDFKCPKCGYEDRFDIESASIFTMTDDGEDTHFDVEWDDHSYCKCCSCDFAGTVSQFKGGYPAKDPKVMALESFCSTIESTGGLNAEGNPVADEDWIDLGDAYAEACEVLGRKPVQETTDGS